MLKISFSFELSESRFLFFFDRTISLTVFTYHNIHVTGERSRLDTMIPPKPNITPIRTLSLKAFSGDLLPKYFFANCTSKSMEGMIKNAHKTTITIDVIVYAFGIKVGSRKYSKTVTPASTMQIGKTINNCCILFIAFSLQLFLRFYNNSYL